MTPFFSIIIPSYNRANSLPETVFSILNQTYREFEIIIVDDGSIDNTREVVSKMTDSRIHYVYQDNKGVCSARNTGIRMSVGKYICFVDSDDIVTENWLLDFCLKAQQNSADLIFCDMRIIHINGFESIRRAKYPYSDTYYSNTGLYMSGTFTITRELIFKVGGFDENIRYGEFTDLMFTLLNYNTKRNFTDKIGIIYRPALDGGGRNHKNKLEAIFYLLKKHKWYFKRNHKTRGLYYQNAGFCYASLNQNIRGSKMMIKSFFSDPFNFKYLIYSVICAFPYFFSMYKKKSNRIRQ